jgi:1,4-alpha-glucan branching enzyme
MLTLLAVAVLFQCQTNGAKVVYLAGDFNDWAHNQAGVISSPAAAMTESNGVWRKVVPLEPGTWRFKFNVNGATNGWFATDGEHDADGNSIIRVHPTGEVEIRNAHDPRYRPRQTEQGVVFQCLAPEAHIVYLAGDFNAWAKNWGGLVFDPQFAMTLSNDVWIVTIPLPPGKHEYQFVVDGDRWLGDGHSVVEVK